LKKVYEEGKAEMRAVNDAAAYQAFKKTVEDRANALKGTKPGIPDEQFEANLKKWGKLVADKKKTPDEIIATAQSKNALTENQIAAIKALGVDSAAAAAPEAIADLIAKAEAATVTQEEIARHLGDDHLKPGLKGITNEQLQRALAFVKNPAGTSK
jgi:hypothetical protein